MNTRLRSAVGPVLVIAALVSLVLLGASFVMHGRINADEGFYLMAARLVADGRMPYRDFGITQPPGLLWVAAPALPLIGWSLAGIRMLNLILAVLATLAGVAVLRRRAGWLTAGCFVTLLLSSPGWLSFMAKGKTYALAAVCVLIAALALTATGSVARRWLVFTLAAAAGACTRLPTAAFFLVGWIYFFVIAGNTRRRCWGAGLSLTGAAALIALCTGGAWQEAWFWTVRWHLLGDASRTAVSRWVGFFDLAPATWISVSLLLPALAQRQMPVALRVLAASIVVAVVAAIGTPAGYGEYAAPLVPAATLLVVCAIPHVIAFSNVKRRSLLGAAIAVGLLLGLLRLPEFSFGVTRDAAEAAAFLRENVPLDRPVIASMPEIPAAAGHRVPPELAMGKFALTESLDAATARHHHMVTPDDLVALIADPATGAVVMFHGTSANFAWSMPELHWTSQATLERITAAINDHYRIAYSDVHYMVFLRRTDESASP